MRHGMAVSSSPSTDATSLSETEYQQVRTLLQDYDGRTHDLHKLGFTFITALLTAQALLLPSLGHTGAGSSSITDLVKLGVLLVTLVLIVGLRSLERSYQLFIKAANDRAMILERRLNFELSQTLTARNRERHSSRWVTLLYSLLVVSTLVLGGFILPWELGTILVAIGVVAIGFMIYVGGWRRLAYPHGEEDWSVDTLQCARGGKIRITVTNLSEGADIVATVRGVDAIAGSIVILPNDIVWKMVPGIGNSQPQPSSKPEGSVETASERIVVPPRGQQSWFWDTTMAPPSGGIYRLYPSMSTGQRGSSMGRALWPVPIPPEILVLPAKSMGTTITGSISTSA